MRALFPSVLNFHTFSMHAMACSELSFLVIKTRLVEQSELARFVLQFG